MGYSCNKYARKSFQIFDRISTNFKSLKYPHGYKSLSKTPPNFLRPRLHSYHIMPCRLRLTKRNADVGILPLIDPVIKHFNKSVLRRDAVNLREPAILKFFIIDPAAVAYLQKRNIGFRQLPPNRLFGLRKLLAHMLCLLLRFILCNSLYSRLTT